MEFSFQQWAILCKRTLPSTPAPIFGSRTFSNGTLSADSGDFQITKESLGLKL